MNYTECLEYIHSISWTFCKPGLERIGELCHKLGEPQGKLKFIHVAGTNGKGSTCSMLSSVLQSAGYRVGLYTSPYIKAFNERMQINGQNISDDELAEITEYIKPVADAMTDSPTEFELITAVAFEYFKRHDCDVVVLEAGMGGRLDSTNIIESSLLSVITGIALDHTAFLGDTVEKIAAEKAGIIKTGCPVLFGGTHNGAAQVIAERAEACGSEFLRVNYNDLKMLATELSGTQFDFGAHKNMRIQLLGAYQPRNAAVVISAVEILRRRGLAISEEALRAGLAAAKWSGRFELLGREPVVIFDGAHNPDGIASAIESIKLYFGSQKIYLLTGVLRDKDYAGIAADLSSIASHAFTLTPPSPRALEAAEYANVLRGAGIAAVCHESGNNEQTCRMAYEAAAQSRIPLVCLGSLYLYSEIIPYLKNIINGENYEKA